MPIVERHPHIDPTVKHVGISKLRGLNADKLRSTTDTLVIQENDQPLAVLLTYDRFLAMQADLEAFGRTVAMLSDPEEISAFMAGIKDVEANRLHSLAVLDQEPEKK